MLVRLVKGRLRAGLFSRAARQCQENVIQSWLPQRDVVVRDAACIQATHQLREDGRTIDDGHAKLPGLLVSLHFTVTE